MIDGTCVIVLKLGTRHVEVMFDNIRNGEHNTIRNRTSNTEIGRAKTG